MQYYKVPFHLIYVQKDELGYNKNFLAFLEHSSENLDKLVRFIWSN